MLPIVPINDSCDTSTGGNKHSGCTLPNQIQTHLPIHIQPDELDQHGNEQHRIESIHARQAKVLDATNHPDRCRNGIIRRVKAY